MGLVVVIIVTECHVFKIPFLGSISGDLTPVLRIVLGS